MELGGKVAVTRHLAGGNPVEPIERSHSHVESPVKGHKMQNTIAIQKPSSLTLDLLEWVARTPRTYHETMEVWRSSCPRLAIWEDALADGLVAVENDNSSGVNQTLVVVSAPGRSELAGNR